MNQELAYNLLEILQTMQEAAKQMQQQYAAGNIQEFNSLSMDLWDGLTAVKEIAAQEVPTGSRIRLADGCTCALESLKDIKMFAITNPEKVEWKLEYELDPIIETAAIQFYYWGIVYEHPEKEEEFRAYLKETDTFALLRVPKEERQYPVDLLIMVLAYNHLDYTMQCVESVLHNLPKKINTEVVLFNHGSTDGTKALFEGMEGVKVLNVAVNGAMPGMVVKANSRGKYYLQISNDIVIGENALDNLYRCAAEHPNYGYVVPTTPAVSNLQVIPADYTTREQFETFARNNNQYDEKKQEQRVRLCNPIQILPSEVFVRMMQEMYTDKCCNVQALSFPDDKNSLWMRRNGYKCILAKDAYCHHFGSVTLKHDLGKEKQQEKFYLDGRKAFMARYGVDPWGLGFCYDYDLFHTWEIPCTDNAYVLGINCGLGSNSLKVKEILREKGAKGVILHNGTQEERFLQDLKGVSDEAFSFGKLSEIIAKTGRKNYNYIVVEGTVVGSKPNNIVQEIIDAGLVFEELAYKTPQGQWKIFQYQKEEKR